MTAPSPSPLNKELNPPAHLAGILAQTAEHLDQPLEKLLLIPVQLIPQTPR